MYLCAWPGIPTAPGVGGDAQVFRKRWGSSVARGGVATPPQLILGYSIQVEVVTPSISTARGRVKRGRYALQREDRYRHPPKGEFRVFHNALLRLPQNSYSARWVSDPGIPWQGIHAPLIWFLGNPMGIPLSGIPSTPGVK